MCGRYSIYDIAEIQTRFNLKPESVSVLENFNPAYNAAPSMELPIINENNEIIFAKWGLTPFWAKDNKFKSINARVETMNEKSAFRGAKPCLVPANNFFEWDKNKIPFLIKTDEKLIAFAGLYTIFNEKPTYAIITADSTFKKIHDRMPVILNRDQEQNYLNTKEIIDPINKFQIIQVTKKVNKVDYQNSDILEPATTLSSF